MSAVRVRTNESGEQPHGEIIGRGMGGGERTIPHPQRCAYPPHVRARAGSPGGKAAHGSRDTRKGPRDEGSSARLTLLGDPDLEDQQTDGMEEVVW